MNLYNYPRADVSNPRNVVVGISSCEKDFAIANAQDAMRVQRTWERHETVLREICARCDQLCTRQLAVARVLGVTGNKDDRFLVCTHGATALTYSLLWPPEIHSLSCPSVPWVTTAPAPQRPTSRATRPILKSLVFLDLGTIKREIRVPSKNNVTNF